MRAIQKMNDEEVWIYFIKGEQSAFEEVYRRYHPVLSAYGMRLTGDPEIVADSLQNLFVKLIRNCSRLNPVANLKCYLISAFRNGLYDEFSRMRPTVNLDENIDFFTLDNQETFGKDDAELRQEARIAEILRKLSKKQKEVLYLYYVKGLSHKEIANILSINSQSSKNLLFRTIVNIRNRLFSVYTLICFTMMESVGGNFN